jgi:hypothetical protein
MDNKVEVVLTLATFLVSGETVDQILNTLFFKCRQNFEPKIISKLMSFVEMQFLLLMKKYNFFIFLFFWIKLVNFSFFYPKIIN